jgi:hypothetical protein
MHSLTAYDIWLTTAPRESEDAAWEAYADRYHDRAQQIVVDFITDTLPTGVDVTDRVTLVTALTAVVRALDIEMVTAWARELSDDVPSFEQWFTDQRERAA